MCTICAEGHTHICGTSWCKQPIAEGERICTVGGVEICRRCYQYIWELAKKRKITLKKIGKKFSSIPKPPYVARIKKLKKSVCARAGCKVVFEKGEGGGNRRHINDVDYCRRCYQHIWEFSHKENISLQEAAEKVSPVGVRESKYHDVSCAMPWCKGKVKNKSRFHIAEDKYACKECRSYLSRIAKGRFRTHKRTWQHWAEEAIKGRLGAFGSKEKCSLPWCSAVSVPRSYGPTGEPICNTDNMYLYYYSKRHGITVDKAFLVAPAPRKISKVRKANVPQSAGK